MSNIMELGKKMKTLKHTRTEGKTNEQQKKQWDSLHMSSVDTKCIPTSYVILYMQEIGIQLDF